MIVWCWQSKNWSGLSAGAEPHRAELPKVMESCVGDARVSQHWEGK